MASATASPVLTHRCPCHARCLPCPCPLVCPAGTILYAGARYRAISKFALVVLRERNPSRQVSTAQHTSRPWPRGPACLATLVLPWRPLACCCTNSAASSCRQHFQPPPTDLPPHLACAAVLRRLEGGCLEWGEARCIESPLPEPHAQGAGTQGRRRHRCAVASRLINCRQGGQPLAAAGPRQPAVFLLFPSQRWLLPPHTLPCLPTCLLVASAIQHTSRPYQPPSWCGAGFALNPSVVPPHPTPVLAALPPPTLHAPSQPALAALGHTVTSAELEAFCSAALHHCPFLSLSSPAVLPCHALPSSSSSFRHTTIASLSSCLCFAPLHWMTQLITLEPLLTHSPPAFARVGQLTVSCSSSAPRSRSRSRCTLISLYPETRNERSRLGNFH